jgi:predicted porin
VTRLSSDNYASSRLGFRGVEDLGGGLKAKFVLEHNVKVDTGAQGNTRFWDRAAWVGLEGAYGELRLGRIDSSIGLLAGNSAILGAQAYDDLKIAKTFAGDTYRRVDNGITYVLPKLADGLSAQIQYTTAAGSSSVLGEEVADVDTGKAFGLNVQYVAGPFGAGLGYISAAIDNDNDDQGVLAYASYDFGVAKLTGYYNQDDRDTKDDARSLYGIKVGIPFSADFSLTAGVSKVSNVNFVKDADATIIAIKGVYNLSKRTALYGLLTTVDNDEGSSLGLATTASGKSSHGVAFGIRHAF